MARRPSVLCQADSNARRGRAAGFRLGRGGSYSRDCSLPAVPDRMGYRSAGVASVTLHRYARSGTLPPIGSLDR
jgi:hypothetical protein